MTYEQGIIISTIVGIFGFILVRWQAGSEYKESVAELSKMYDDSLIKIGKMYDASLDRKGNEWLEDYNRHR